MVSKRVRQRERLTCVYVGMNTIPVTKYYPVHVCVRFVGFDIYISDLRGKQISIKAERFSVFDLLQSEVYVFYSPEDQRGFQKAGDYQLNHLCISVSLSKGHLRCREMKRNVGFIPGANLSRTFEE